MLNQSKSNGAENGEPGPSPATQSQASASAGHDVKSTQEAGYELTCIGQFLIDNNGNVSQFPDPVQVGATQALTTCVMVTGSPDFHLKVRVTKDPVLFRLFPTATGTLYPLSLFPGIGNYSLTAFSAAGVVPADARAGRINIGDVGSLVPRGERKS